MDVEQLVMEVQAGDVDAFTELVRRYQAMAFGYAYANLGDFHAAEDVTQAAFLAAWRNISTLHHPDRFGGWLRGIVRFECSRHRRRRDRAHVPLDDAQGIVSQSPGPADLVEQREGSDRILKAILGLPEPERDVTMLFYIEDHSQRDVAGFLNLPLTTVNNRLRSARNHLKEERLSLMARDALQHHGLPDDFAEHVGEIVRADGPIINARFTKDQRPAMLNMVTVRDDTNGTELAGPVTQYLDDTLVRGILGNAATHQQPGLRTGMQVKDTATPVSVPLDHDAIRQLVTTLRRAEGPSVVLETGIKAIDVCCPLRTGGLVGIAGDQHAGKMVLVEELVHRLGDTGNRLAVLVFVETASEVAVIRQFEYRASAAVEVIYLPVADASPQALGELTAPLDAVIAITRTQAEQGLYPAIDPRQSTSRLLEPAVVGQRHVDVLRGIHQMLDTVDPATAQAGAPPRARLIQRFLTQPFFIAEAFTNRPGVSVSREDAVAGCQALLTGAHDDLNEDALYMTGTLDDALANR